MTCMVEVHTTREHACEVVRKHTQEDGMIVEKVEIVKPNSCGIFAVYDGVSITVTEVDKDAKAPQS